MTELFVYVIIKNSDWKGDFFLLSSRKDGFMAYVSLYRKYRPTDFNSVIGQDYIVTTLKNQVKSGNVSHAYLFTGTRGTGKTTVSRIFAKAVNCLSPIDGSPCGKCAACLASEHENNVDIIEIDAASNNGVDDARTLRDSVNFAPANSKYKVYIIDEVHQLSGAAFNALLKTLEEPPSYVIFILATTELHKVPQTILSRCIKFEFRLISTDLLKEQVKAVYDAEGVSYTDEALNVIAKQGNGSSRDMLSFADACMAYTNKIDYTSVLEVMGANDPEIVADMVFAMLSNDGGKVLGLINESVSKGKNIMRLTGDITECLRNLLLVKKDKNAKEFLSVPEKLFKKYTEIADKFSGIEILRALEAMCGVDMEMKYSAYPQIVLETSVVKIAELSGRKDTDIISRIDACERKIKEGVTVKVESMLATQVVESKEEAPSKTKENVDDNPMQGVNISEISINDSIFSGEVTTAMRRLKSAVIEELRKSRSNMLLSFVFAEATTFLKVDGNNVLFMYDYEKEGDNPIKPDNLLAIKSALRVVLGLDEINLDVKKYNPKEKRPAIDTIKELFGADLVTIKKQ